MLIPGRSDILESGTVRRQGHGTQRKSGQAGCCCTGLARVSASGVSCWRIGSGPADGSALEQSAGRL